VDVFSEAVERIARAYEDLGHELGWRFLYSPAHTLSERTRMGFFGLNPGGASYGAPVASVEESNAYRVEGWGVDGGPNGLQRQVGLLYEVLSAKTGLSAKALMDGTLASNFCPFRSASWRSLPKKGESMAFSYGLWSYVFGYVRPSTMICLTDKPFRYLERVLLDKGFRRTYLIRESVGWGDVTYSHSEYASGSGHVSMVRLPHLSRYRIFGKAECRDAVDRLTDAVVGSLSEHRPGA
jgi:hypothetical protein